MTSAPHLHASPCSGQPRKGIKDVSNSPLLPGGTNRGVVHTSQVSACPLASLTCLQIPPEGQSSFDKSPAETSGSASWEPDRRRHPPTPARPLSRRDPCERFLVLFIPESPREHVRSITFSPPRQWGQAPLPGVRASPCPPRWSRGLRAVLTFAVQTGQADVQADVDFAPAVLVWVIDVELVHAEGDKHRRLR